LPGRVDCEQAGWLLAFSEAEIGVLMSEGALVPLGTPAQNGKKMFSTSLILQIKDDPEMLYKFTEVIQMNTREKNKRISKRSDSVKDKLKRKGKTT
jgi:hypothetical protein